MEEKEKKNNNKPLIAILLIALIGLIGTTVAIFTSSTTLTNLFGTGKYSAKTEEKFTSPSNWRPGQEVTKEVKVTNTGDYEMAVRAKLEPKWTSANSTNLNLQIDGTDVAQINFPNPEKWQLGQDGYYYYVTSLKKNGVTDLLIDKVTLNENLDAEDLGISCTESDVKEGETVVGKESTCVSSNTGYAGATYELKITVETIQYDQYATEWAAGKVTINQAE